MAKRTAFQTCVYRLYNADDQLLYVGCCHEWGVRISQHSRTQPWGDQIVKVTIEHHESAASAAAAEVAAIASERPLHNIDHHPERPKRASGELSRCILVALAELGQATSKDVATHIGCSVSSVGALMPRLLDADEVAVVGSVPSTHRMGRWPESKVYALASEVAA